MVQKKKEKKGGMLKTVFVILLTLLIAFLAVSFYTGLLNRVTLKKEAAGPYYLACLDNIGSYKGIAAKIISAKKLLNNQNIVSVAACGIYYDDPRNIPTDKLRSKGGCLVAKDSSVDILEKLTIPQREAIVAKIKAKPALAAMKVYPKINKWIAANNYQINGPALEIYHKDGTVEIQMPVIPSPKPISKPSPKLSPKPAPKPAPKPKDKPKAEEPKEESKDKPAPEQNK